MYSNVKKTLSSHLNSLLIQTFPSSGLVSCYMNTRRRPLVRKSGLWSASSPASAPWDWINPSGWQGNFSTPWPPWANPLILQTPRCTWYVPSGPVWGVIQKPSCKEVQMSFPALLLLPGWWPFKSILLNIRRAFFRFYKQKSTRFWFIASFQYEPLIPSVFLIFPGLICCSYIHQSKMWGPA